MNEKNLNAGTNPKQCRYAAAPSLPKEYIICSAFCDFLVEREVVKQPNATQPIRYGYTYTNTYIRLGWKTSNHSDTHLANLFILLSCIDV